MEYTRHTYGNMPPCLPYAQYYGRLMRQYYANTSHGLMCHYIDAAKPLAREELVEVPHTCSCSHPSSTDFFVPVDEDDKHIITTSLIGILGQHACAMSKCGDDFRTENAVERKERPEGTRRRQTRWICASMRARVRPGIWSRQSVNGGMGCRGHQ